MLHILLIALGALALVNVDAADITSCPPRPPLAANIDFFIGGLPPASVLLDPSGAPTIDSSYRAIFLLSPDGGTMWDKSCGYPYHHGAAAPPPARPRKRAPLNPRCPPPPATQRASLPTSSWARSPAPLTAPRSF